MIDSNPVPHARTKTAVLPRHPWRWGHGGGRPETPTFEADEDLAGVMKGHGPCTYLLLSLLALILVYPYLLHGVFGRIAMGILYYLVLLFGAYAIAGHRQSIIFRVGLSVLGIALQWTALLTENPVAMRLT